MQERSVAWRAAPLGFEALVQEVLKPAARGERVRLDLTGREALSSREVATLLRLISVGAGRGVEVRLAGLSPVARAAFVGLPEDLLQGEPEPPPAPWLERVGAGALEQLHGARQVVGLIGELFHFLVLAPLRGQGIKWGRVVDQINLVAVNGVPIVVFLAFLIGAVMGINGAAQLRQFGAAIYVADLVSVAVTREMGPLLTAVIVAGRSGSAITAELGTMTVSEEIDAMRAMALPPGRYLLVPRVLALVFGLPCLTLLADLAGISGGGVVAAAFLQISPQSYIDETAQALLRKDLISGLIKSAVYALLIGLTACYYGLHVRGGSEGVGAATTRSVVTSIVLCIFANAVFTTFFYFTGG